VLAEKTRHLHRGRCVITGGKATQIGNELKNRKKPLQEVKGKNLTRPKKSAGRAPERGGMDVKSCREGKGEEGCGS